MPPNVPGTPVRASFVKWTSRTRDAFEIVHLSFLNVLFSFSWEDDIPWVFWRVGYFVVVAFLFLFVLRINREWPFPSCPYTTSFRGSLYFRIEPIQRKGKANKAHEFKNSCPNLWFDFKELILFQWPWRPLRVDIRALLRTEPPLALNASMMFWSRL